MFSLSRLPVCSSCLETIEPITQPRCNLCGNLLSRADAAFGDARCPVCMADEPAFARAVHFAAYNGVPRQLVHLLKYERLRPAAHVLGRMVAQACLQLEGDIDVEELLVIPVPVHKLRLRSRGFNQAELIARAALHDAEESIGRRLTLDTTTLLRVRFAESQVGATLEERRRQIRGSFKVISRERVRGRDILLVDDVLTTGATASECARELRQAGAARVWVVTPARALSRVAVESLASMAGTSLAVEENFSPELVSGKQVQLSSSHPFGSEAAQGTLLQRRGIPSAYGEQPAGWHAARDGLS